MLKPRPIGLRFPVRIEKLLLAVWFDLEAYGVECGRSGIDEHGGVRGGERGGHLHGLSGPDDEPLGETAPDLVDAGDRDEVGTEPLVAGPAERALARVPSSDLRDSEREPPDGRERDPELQQQPALI